MSPQSYFIFALGTFAPALPPGHADEPAKFLATYCYQCHDESEQKGDRRFDELEFPIADAHGILDVQDIIDQLNLGEMPPKKAEKHPGEKEVAAVIESLTASVAKARETIQSTGGQTILRRLNRREYRNTVSDLFDIDLTAFDPTSKFPVERTVDHMDNIGDTLVTSGYLLDQYLEAADVIVEKALGPGRQTRGTDLALHQ